jgi:amino acid adenylation domain-containing protein
LIKDSPKLGKRKIIESINPDIIITDFESSSSLIKNRVSVSEMLIVEEISGEGEQFPPTGFKKTIDMDPAYIMHTSGSTGEPKGVIIQHRSLLDYIDWIGKTFKMNEDTIIGCNQNFGFDNSLLDIFSMVCYGSRIILKRNEKEKDQKDKQMITQKYMNDLIENLNTYQVNLVFYTPSMLKLFANNDGFKVNKPEYLKQVLFCGEVMPNKQLNYWRRHLPGVQYANLYGPTEITDVCTYYMVDRDFGDNESLPIGIPCENTDVLILNEHDKPVKIEEIGEILVRGTGVSCGYWKKPEKTAEVFVQNPLHDNYRDVCYKTGDIGTYNDKGEILFIGRKDSQIQFHGLRLELGEIETALNLMKPIKNCAVFYVDTKEKIIVFYEAEQKIPKIDIMRFLYDKIPVMPAEFIQLDQFPSNTNGKVDRKKLSERLITCRKR